MATTLRFKMLHVTVGDNQAWQMLADAHDEGWRIDWQEYAARQFHFLLVTDSNAG